MPSPEIYKSEIGSLSTMRQVHTGAYVSLLTLEKRTIPLAIQERLPRVYYAWYRSLRIRTTDASQLKKRSNENKR